MASGVWQSLPGLPRQFTYVVTRAQIPTLTLSSVTINLNAPGQDFLPRLNQLDIRFSRTFQRRGIRVAPEIDVFNVTNDATVLSQVNSFGPALGRVQSILDGRVVRLGVQLSHSNRSAVARVSTSLAYQ